MRVPVSVALVDDHAILLEGMVSLYSEMDDIEIIGQGESADDALAIVSELRPNVIVVDLNMPGDALAAISSIVRDHPETRIVVFTATESIDLAVKALGLGASGYVLKGSPAGELYKAIKSVNAGGTFIAPAFAPKVISSMKAAKGRQKDQMREDLSPRETDILQLLLLGKTNKEIASSLNLTEITIKHHMTILMQKMNARSRLEVFLAAQRMGTLN